MPSKETKTEEGWRGDILIGSESLDTLFIANSVRKRAIMKACGGAFEPSFS